MRAERVIVTRPPMKVGFSLLTGLGLVLCGTSCDRHSWEDDPETGAKGTKRLFATHHGSGHDNHGDDTHKTGKDAHGDPHKEVERNAHGTSDPHNAANASDEAGH